MQAKHTRPWQIRAAHAASELAQPLQGLSAVKAVGCKRNRPQHSIISMFNKYQTSLPPAAAAAAQLLPRHIVSRKGALTACQEALQAL
jgi:hypothetical protein